MILISTVNANSRSNFSTVNIYLLICVSLYQTSIPTSVLSGTPNFPSVNCHKVNIKLSQNKTWYKHSQLHFVSMVLHSQLASNLLNRSSSEINFLLTFIKLDSFTLLFHLFLSRVFDSGPAFHT